MKKNQKVEMTDSELLFSDSIVAGNE